MGRMRVRMVVRRWYCVGVRSVDIGLCRLDGKKVGFGR